MPVIDHDHDHAFTLSAHVDACHEWTSVWTCVCGAILTERAERDPNDDPFAAVWFDDTCDRCGRLADGAKPQQPTSVIS